MVDINTLKKGKMIRYVNPNAGYDFDKEKVAEHLTLHNIYKVSKYEIYNWKTDIYLEDFDDIRFNSVHFEDVIEENDWDDVTNINTNVFDLHHPIGQDIMTVDEDLIVCPLHGTHEHYLSVTWGALENEDHGPLACLYCLQEICEDHLDNVTERSKGTSVYKLITVEKPINI